MVKLCLKCFEIFDKAIPWGVCPKINCDGDTVKVDDLILPAIISLNQHGCYTRYCCSGHIAEFSNLADTYISFTDEGFAKLKSLTPEPPKYWRYSYSEHGTALRPIVESDDTEYAISRNNMKNGSKNIHGTFLFLENYRFKFNHLTTLMESLYNWVDELIQK